MSIRSMLVEEQRNVITGTVIIIIKYYLKKLVTRNRNIFMVNMSSNHKELKKKN